MSRHSSVLSGLIILIVESEPIIKDILIDVLEALGASTLFEERMQGAVACLRSFIPDCVVCNINLLDGSGYSLIEHLRQLEAANGITPTPAISVFESEQVMQAQHPLESGFHGVITQPWKIQEVIDTVLQVTGRI